MLKIKIMEDQYSSKTGLLYIFNLIVGTGALTLPKAFSEAGWALSFVLMVFLAIFSYITATFVIESISLCSSILQWQRVEHMKKVSRDIRLAAEAGLSSEDDVNDTREDSLMLPQEYIESFPSEPQRLFTLDNKLELSEMATILFNRVGQFVFYICLCLYLYGDLTIYSAAIAKTLVDTTCTFNNPNNTSSDLCWESYNFKRGTMYKFYLGIFLLFFGPYVFFKVQKTKYLQFVTSLSRWLAFALMIGLSIKRLAMPGVEHGHPVLYHPAGFPALLGSCVYSFMCHHSLPSLITPISNKSKLFAWLAMDYLAILFFYLTLALIAVFAFPSVLDLFTLNFAPTETESTAFQEITSYFLTLFPVFTLSTSFPILAVTLRSNLQAMFVCWQWRILHSVFIPILTVVPPVLIAMSTDNIETLVGITGSFAGVIIQYVIPASIVIMARKEIPVVLKNIPNPHSSPFKTIFWPVLILIWAVVCIVIVIFNITNLVYVNIPVNIF